VPLRDPHDVSIHAQDRHAVIRSVVVHEVDHLRPCARGLARVRHARTEGEGKHDDDRDRGGDAAGTHVGVKLLSRLLGFSRSS